MSDQPSSSRPVSGSPNGVTIDWVADRYDPLVEDARRRFHGGRVVRSVVYGTLDPPELEALLISFCALGVQMTEPVAGWIERAGRACMARGFRSLGSALIRHAEREVGHELLLEADARSLIQAWNRNARLENDLESGAGPRSLVIDADGLLSRAPTGGIRDYVELHESMITGDSPFAQIAIEYEIEMLSITLGVALLKQIPRLCRPGLLGDLTFIAHHVELDEGHTAFNRRQLNDFLHHHPDTVAAVAAAGSRALDAYGRFLDDCHRLGRRLLAGDERVER